MIKRGLFKNPKNQLEGNPKLQKYAVPCVTDEMSISCPSCKKALLNEELAENFNVCSKCGYHFRLNARQRIRLISDGNTFSETDAGLSSQNILDFPDYDKKLENARLESAEKEAVVCGNCEIGGYHCCIFVMEPYFMMGSMGVAVGEKITRLFELALEKSLPVVGFTVSGGARMQEGIMSLMQMAKTSGAVKRHGDAGNLYVAVLTDPTTGGVTASFATEADIIIAEPGALVGFAGPRVIEQTIRQKLPHGFQSAEFLLEKGFLDDIVSRILQKDYLTKLLFLHDRGRKS
ncbi:MAG: acetyl-CoA carboxylase, carboxyltransferase subunit beta [Bacillota bacterium]|nr:acetyl-CoA carboxylase, carboxyltransferase subunit beta [Bacillota bacterium]